MWESVQMTVWWYRDYYCASLSGLSNATLRAFSAHVREMRGDVAEFIARNCASHPYCAESKYNVLASHLGGLIPRNLRALRNEWRAEYYDAIENGVLGNGVDTNDSGVWILPLMLLAREHRGARDSRSCLFALARQSKLPILLARKVKYRFARAEASASLYETISSLCPSLSFCRKLPRLEERIPMSIFLELIPNEVTSYWRRDASGSYRYAWVDHSFLHFIASRKYDFASWILTCQEQDGWGVQMWGRFLDEIIARANEEAAIGAIDDEDRVSLIELARAIWYSDYKLIILHNIRNGVNFDETGKTTRHVAHVRRMRFQIELIVLHAIGTSDKK